MMEVQEKGRVIVFSYGSRSSGIPANWAAAKDKPGVNLLKDLSKTTVRHIREQIEQVKQHRDIVVASIHWGSNWGYDVPHSHTEFAHELIDAAGVDVIHGRSSHHVLAMEVYKGKLIIYGSGDFLNAGDSLRTMLKKTSTSACPSSTRSTSCESWPNLAGVCG